MSFRPVLPCEPDWSRCLSIFLKLQLLGRMFNDRAQSFNSVQKIGHDILASQPDKDSAAKTKEDLDRVTELWTSLNSAVGERKQKLDNVLPISQDFVGKFDEASKQLNAINKSLDDERWIPLASEDGIRKQIEDMKVNLSCWL